jgi:hypothetical protein
MLVTSGCGVPALAGVPDLSVLGGMVHRHVNRRLLRAGVQVFAIAPASHYLLHVA